MAEPFIFINTYAIQDGRLDDYKEACEKVIELVEKEEPRVLYLAFYINEEGTEATTFQIHPDAESMDLHMKLAAEAIQASVEFVDFSTMSIQVYGAPSESVMENMRQAAGSGVPVSLKGAASLVDRLPPR